MRACLRIIAYIVNTNIIYTKSDNKQTHTYKQAKNKQTIKKTSKQGRKLSLATNNIMTNEFKVSIFLSSGLSRIK